MVPQILIVLGVLATPGGPPRLDPEMMSRAVQELSDASEGTWRIAFDSRLASTHQYPALHPLASRSSAEVDAEHARIAHGARALLARYRALVPDLGEGDTARLTQEERGLVGRARRLQAYLTQPFISTEAFNGEPGSVVSYVLPSCTAEEPRNAMRNWPSGLALGIS